MTENPQESLVHRGFAFDAKTYKWVKGNYAFYIPSAFHVDGIVGGLIWIGEWRDVPVCWGTSVDATIDHLELFDGCHDAGDEASDEAGEIRGNAHCMKCGVTSNIPLMDFHRIMARNWQGIRGRGKCPICGRGVSTILPGRYSSIL